MVGRTRRVTLRDAAQVLGISKDAVRKRINRGTLDSDMGEDGRRYVYLPAGGDAGGDVEEKLDQNSSPVFDHRDALIAELQTEVEAWREESRRKDLIISRFVERLPQLEAPRDERESPVEATEGRGGGDVPQEPERTVPRPFWRRWFRG